MNFTNYSNFNNDNNSDNNSNNNTVNNNVNNKNVENKKGNRENFNLNREMGILIDKKTNKDYLNDRDMFFKISNNNEGIDVTNPNFDDFSGMPINNIQILNNKKNLINNPHIYEKTNQKISCINEFSQSNTNDYSNINENYEELEAELVSLNDSLDMMEKDIVNHEFTNLIKNNKILNVISPFSLAYLWKSIILLSKNPSTEKLLNLMGFKKKEILLNDMKNHCELIKNLLLVECQLPISDNVFNSTFAEKISDIYNIKVNVDEKEYNEKIKINLMFNYILQIPSQYKPEIISGQLKDNSNKIKFIKLTNVPISLQVLDDNVIIELDLIESIIGFTFKKSEKNVELIDYELLIKEKEFNFMAKTFIFPKINKQSKCNYGKQFNLGKIHLGEILYGKMFDLDINTNLLLDIAINNNININIKNFKINGNIEEINLNHQLYFYIKDKKINNRIICCGLINY
jgi:hypothetical protein